MKETLALLFSHVHITSMSIQFNPRFSLSRRIKEQIATIERIKPVKGRCTARRRAKELFIGMEDQSSLKGYLAAYDQVMKWADAKEPLTEALIKKLHSLILGHKKADSYRKGQNAVLDPTEKEILYLPPKPKDVAPLMKSLVKWINTSSYMDVITAGVAHLGINSIHPYYDGNGRLARLLTKFLLRKSGCDLGGHLVLEDYYCKDLNAYYEALTIGHSTDYYSGPAKHKVTGWLEYFLDGYLYSAKMTST